MKHGHVTGHKKERKGASDWYKAIEEENIEGIQIKNLNTWCIKKKGWMRPFA